MSGDKLLMIGNTGVNIDVLDGSNLESAVYYTLCHMKRLLPESRTSMDKKLAPVEYLNRWDVVGPQICVAFGIGFSGSKNNWSSGYRGPDGPDDFVQGDSPIKCVLRCLLKRYWGPHRSYYNWKPYGDAI